MATFFLCPISTIFQYFTDTGVVLNGGKINTYLAGTTTPTQTWTDSTGVTPNSNPLILAANGRLNNVQIWQKSNVPIKIIITDANNNQIGPPFDNVSGVGDPGALLNTFYGGNDTGVANAYVLNFTANFNSYTNGLVIYWIPSNSNSAGASTININGLGTVNITNADGSALIPFQIISGQLAIIASQGGNFVLLSAGIISGSFTPAWTGFGGSPPTGTMYYQIVGNQASLEWVGTTGTSTSTSLSIANIPIALRPVSKASLLGQQVTVVIDNGAAAIGTWNFTGLSSIQFNKGTAPPSATGFTAAGPKGLDLGWSTNYFLR